MSISSTTPQAWWRADAITPVADGTVVTSWSDSSGNGFTASNGSSTAVYKTAQSPTGLPVVRFLSKGLSSGAFAAASTQTVACVVRVSSSSGNRTVVGCNGAGQGLQLRIDNGTNKVVVNASHVANVATSSGSLTVGSFAIVVFTYTVGSAWAIRINRALDSSGTSSASFGSDNRQIGNDQTDFFDGDIAEIVTWQRVLSGSEITDVESELNSRWINSTATSGVGNKAGISAAPVVVGGVGNRAGISAAPVVVSGVGDGAGVAASPVVSSGVSNPAGWAGAAGPTTEVAGIGNPAGIGATPVAESGTGNRAGISSTPVVTSGVGNPAGWSSLDSTSFVSEEAYAYAESWATAEGPVLFDTAELGAYAYSWATAISSLAVTIPPGHIHPACSLKVVTQTGDVIRDLTGAEIGVATQTLNGRGGIHFTLPKGDPDVPVLPQFSEVQLWRGGNLVPGAWFTIVDPDVAAGANKVGYECSGLTYYFERALIGTERPERLRNGGFEEDARYWNFGYAPGSNAEAPPDWEITRDACEGGKALRVFAKDKVVTVRNIVETEAVFVGNEATFLPGGEQAIRDAVQDIPDGTAIIVEGHTADADGGTGYALSVARAEAAATVIHAYKPTLTITTVGKGETEPIDPRHVEAAYRRNRRVEIIATINQTKVGHRQYADQWWDEVVPPGQKESLEHDIQMQARIDTFEGPSKDGWMAYADVRPLSNLSKVLNDANVSIDETSTRGKWMGLNLTVKTPLTAGTYRVTVRCYPTAGSTSFDQVSAKPNLKLAFWQTDPRNIIAGLVAHAQDPAYGKSSRNITVSGPLSGFKMDRDWEWKEAKPVSEAIDDVVRALNGPDANMVVTARRRVLAVAPKAGRRTGLTFAAGELAGDFRIVDYAAGLDGDDVATDVRVQSSWTGGGLTEVFVRAPRADGLVLEKLFRADQDTPTSTCLEQGRAAVKYGRADAVTRIAMHPDDTTRLMEEVAIGDIFEAAISDSRVQVDAPYRIIRIDYDPKSDQLFYDIAEEA